MPRIVGNDIPDKKSIWISLTYIPGIGKFSSEQILKEAEVEVATKAGKLTEELHHAPSGLADSQPCQVIILDAPEQTASQSKKQHGQQKEAVSFNMGGSETVLKGEAGF